MWVMMDSFDDRIIVGEDYPLLLIISWLIDRFFGELKIITSNFSKFQKIPHVKYEQVVFWGNLLRTAFEFDNSWAIEIKNNIYSVNLI